MYNTTDIILYIIKCLYQDILLQKYTLKSIYDRTSQKNGTKNKRDFLSKYPFIDDTDDEADE